MPEESQEERLDRELEELLQELRLALPGVQILFAFLFVVPFNNRFGETDDFQRHVWFAALMLSLGAVTCFIAPTAYHRLRFRDFDKERLVTTASRLAIVGLVFLGSPCRPRRSSSPASSSTIAWPPSWLAAAAGLIGGLWFALPLARKAEPALRTPGRRTFRRPVLPASASAFRACAPRP